MHVFHHRFSAHALAATWFAVGRYVCFQTRCFFVCDGKWMVETKDYCRQIYMRHLKYHQGCIFSTINFLPMLSQPHGSQLGGMSASKLRSIVCKFTMQPATKYNPILLLFFWWVSPYRLSFFQILQLYELYFDSHVIQKHLISPF